MATDWSLVPSGLVAGNQFRLLFRSSTTRDATSTSIGDYNSHVQSAAAAGHTDIQSYSSGFRAVGSTATVDALDNTSTTGTGVAIYWLNGNKVTDNYPGFYDGSWDDEANPHAESGATVSGGSAAFTGTQNDGTKSLLSHLGTVFFSSLTPPEPDKVTTSSLGAVTGDPLQGGGEALKTASRRFYALSEVFEVVAVAPGKPTGLTVGTVTPTKIPLTWTAPTSTGGADITGYTIEQALDVNGMAGTWTNITMSTTTSYTDEALDPETTYHYRVSATNSAGTGTASDSMSGTTLALPVVKVVPRNASVTEGSDAEFDITRTGSTGDAITVYLARSKTGTIGVTAGNFEISMSAGNSAIRSSVGTTDDALDEEDGSVTATLRTASDGVTIVGYTIGTPDSATVTIEDDDTVPGTPIVSAQGLDTKLVLNWSKPAEGTSSINGYDYRYKTTAGGEETWSTWTDTGLSGADATNDFEITGLTNGTDYTVEIQAKSDAGVSLAGSASATPTPPPMITSVAITSTPANANTYIIGDDIEFTLTFDKDLSLGGTDTSKTPGYIIYQTDYAADTASVDSPEADCAIGTNTKTIVCTGQVKVGWYDTDGIFVYANALEDQGQLSHFAGPLGQRINRDHPALAVDSNHKIDGVKPTLITTGTGAPEASSDLSKIVLTFSEAIGSVDRTKITLMSGTNTLTTTADSISGTKVEITLTTALTAADTAVTVELDADAVTDVPGNGIDAVSATAVSVEDTTAPTFVSADTATINTVVVVSLLFDEAIDANSIPDKSAFEVKIAGTAVGVASAIATAVDTRVNLVLDSNPRPGDTITVSYAVPGTNPLQDSSENPVAAFTDEAVANNLAATAPDAPGNLAASAGTVDGTMELTWDTPWANGSDITEFEVRYAAGTSVPPTTTWDDITGSGATTTSHTVTGLTPGTEYTFEVRAVNGIGNGAEASVTETASDTTAPTLDGASTYTVGGGTGISLDFSETIDGTSIPAASAFTVKINDDDVVESSVSRSTTNTDVINVVLGSNPRPGDSVTIEYAKPLSNPLKDAADNEVASFGPVVVDNTLAATAPEAPRSLAAGSYNISTAPVRVAADILELSWIIPWHNGSDITKFEYRYAAGSSVPASIMWVDIPNSAPGHPNDTDFNVTGLDADTEYTFEVRAVNEIEPGPAAAVTRTTPAPNWSFTLRDSANTNVTQLTEGGDSATATVSITNNVRFSTAQTVTLKWGTVDLTVGSVVGAGGATAITISAEQASGSLEISSLQHAAVLYDRPQTYPLSATLGDTELGSIDLTRLDDEDPPVASITQAPTTVNEGDDINIKVTLSVGDSRGGAVRLTVTAPSGTLSGTLPDRAVFAGAETELTVTLETVENTAINDGARDVVLTLDPSPNGEFDIPYTLGDTSSVTITVRDDDTPPLAPQNLRAQAGNTEARLTWDPPLPSTPDHEQPVLRYEYQVKVGNGSFTSWATFPDGDGSTRSHTFTGLTNGTEYTCKVRAVNVAGGGAEDEVMVTPIVGVAVSFGAAALSVNEGEGVTVTVTLATAPAVGTTVTVPITAMPGAGLDSNEYSGVPSSVTFGAGDTSKSFTVTAVPDTDDEPDAVLTLSFGSLPAGYVLGTHAQLALTLVDDDVPIVSATFGAAAASAPEGGSVEVTVTLTSEPEREVVVPIRAARGANLAADEYEGVAASVTVAADETEARFTVTFADDAVVEGNETLTLTFGTLPDRVNAAGANPQLVLTVTDDDGPPAAPDVSAQTGDGFVTLSWDPVANDSPTLRYEVRVDGGAWQSVGLDTSYRYEDLENGREYAFEVRAVNAHGDGAEASAPGTPSQRITRIPTAVQVLRVRATDSGRAELSWIRPANGTDKDYNSSNPNSTMSQLQGYRIEVCRTACGDEANWYALVANTRAFVHEYVHQVLAPGVIRENHYRVQAININGKTGPWSNVATLDPTVVENFRLQTPDDSTLWVRFRVLNPDGNRLYVRYEHTATGAVAYTERRLTKKGDVKLVLSGLEAGSWYRVDLDFSPGFDSSRMQSRWYGTAKEGHTPLRSPYAVDALDAEVWQDGAWRDAPDNALRVRMGGTGRYRVRLKPCGGIHDVIVNRIQAPAARLRASPMDADPVLMNDLGCKEERTGYEVDGNGDFVLDQRGMKIGIWESRTNDWQEVTVTARALEDYPADRRYDALLSAPFAVVYNHEVWKEISTDRPSLVSEGTGLVRVSLDRPADATLPEPTGVTIARAEGASGGPVMSWGAVPGATGYLVEWRHGVHYSDRANQNRSLQTATSVTLPLGGSWRGPITARVRAYSSSGVSGWVERTWDSRPPTLNVLDTAVNEDDGSVGFLVTLSPAASGTVTVDYATVDGTAVADTDYTATSGTLTFAPGETRKSTALVPIADDGEEDSGETFRLVLSNPSGSDANNGAAVLGDAEAVGTILNSEREAAALTGFTLVDAGTNGDLMVLADGSTVELGALLAPSYGIRAEMGPGAAPGSVRLALSGAKTVTHTDDAAPYSLYGDGAGRVNGAGLPAGSYTLTATAFADSGGRGEERGSLEVSFTVTAGALGVTTPGPFRVAEGTTAVTTLGASQTGTGESVSWSIPEGTAGGADGAAFTLDPDGTLALRAAKDFEAPDDADGDGTYAVTVEVRAGAQSATAALLVRLADANEAPVAKAAAAPIVVREGAAVTLDAGASTDPDAGDRLSYAWTQTDEGGPRVTLSDASAAQPVFTAPSDLAAETELAFTLRATDAGGLYAEDTVTVTVSLISEVAIAAASDYAAEGAEAVFRLSRAGSALKALTVPVTVEETGAMLGANVPAEATFAAGARETELRVPTAADAVSETDSLVTVRLGSGSGWQLAADAASASLTVLDDDVAPVTGVSAADVTIWSADMTVVEYGPRSIGASTADQFSNQQGRAGLRAKRLWYDPMERKLRIGFDDGLDDAELLTLHMGAKSVGFPANSGGDSSFTLENVDVSWSDGETLAVRVSKPSAAAVSTDATLASLIVDGAALSPAFDAGVLVYRAVADAETETVTVAALANDGGAAVTYGPADDADTELADHQVAVPDEGETLVEVTVTAADGTVRRYRVVVARAADGANVAPTGLPAISGTPRVGEALTAPPTRPSPGSGLRMTARTTRRSRARPARAGR